MHLLIRTCSSFEVCNYLFEVSYGTDQIIRLILDVFLIVKLAHVSDFK